MFDKLRSDLGRRLHNRAINGVLDTPPIRTTGDPIVFASMVCHRDVLMYLVAVKSIQQRVGKGRVAVIDDGSLTTADLDVLRRHLDDPQIVHINDVPVGRTPRGGTWERLLTCLDLSRDSYVVQVDADLVAASSLDEVAEAIDANAAFTITSRQGPAVVSFTDAATFADSIDGDHIQLLAERAFRHHPAAADMRYIRGCSGFTGFPRGGLTRDFVERLSETMAGLIGPRWAEWGTEQVASNVVFANGHDPRPLPLSRYKNFFPPMDLDGAALVHFLGSHRFHGGHYRRLSTAAIAALRDPRPARRSVA
ncbi:MAG: hypothetical protein JNM50_11260 [Chromatiales bacterium]|nr:hypothetical protein [Chromatiales bacterium]